MKLRTKSNYFVVGKLSDIAARSSSSVGMRSAAAKRFLPNVRIMKPEIIVKQVIESANRGEYFSAIQPPAAAPIDISVPSTVQIQPIEDE